MIKILKNQLFKHINMLQKSLIFESEEFLKKNLLVLLVIDRDSGKLLYNFIRDDFFDPDIIAGFLTAIQGFSNEIISKGSPIEEISYKDFQIKFEDAEYTRIVAIFLKNPNNSISPVVSNKMKDFITQFELKYSEKLCDWKGNLDNFIEADNIVQEIFFNS